MQKIDVAILGATGAVGQRFIALLENHPWFRVTEVVASDRSAGLTYKEAAKWVLDGYPPRDVAELTVKGLDATLNSPIVFSALPGEAAREVEVRLAGEGHVVCSNASTYRMTEDVPLIYPEVNPDHIRLIEAQRRNRGWKDGALVTNSNCTAMPVVMALAPLRQFGLRVLHVVSMQAVSGAGYPGVASLDILDNVVPYIKGEEDKLEVEPHKMLGDLAVDGSKILPLEILTSASCNRVPVVDSHLVSVAVGFEEVVSLEAIDEAWNGFVAPEVVRRLPSAPEYPLMVAYEADRPQPRRDRNAGNGMTTTVGRLRECKTVDGVQFVSLSHNTIRGAAGGSILNAELLVAEGYVTSADPALLAREPVQ
jgi:aspartate-semialdehyde dehydrogenase